MGQKVAYSLFKVKAVNEEERVIKGIATSPEPDRDGDIIDPMGVKFRNPAPLLWMHDHQLPVGSVTFGQPTEKGIPFTAKLPKISEPSQLRARIDEAWQSVKNGLINAVSIGFRPLEYSIMEDTGGYRFTSIDMYELSLVSVPANPNATISQVKSFDAKIRASKGDVTDLSEKDHSGLTEKKNKTVKIARKEGNEMNIFEKLKGFKADRAAKAKKMEELMEKSLESGETFDEATQEEYDTLKGEVKALDSHIEKAEELIKMKEKTAKPVSEEVGSDETKAKEVRSVTGVQIKKQIAKGTGFTRYAIAMANSRGSFSDALNYAKRWEHETPEVTNYIKAVAGSTVTGNWAAPLVDEQNLVSEFVELLRPETIMGKMAGFRNVPFNVRIPVQTGGSTVNWVGQGAVKPVTELAFDTLSLAHNKVAGIVVVTDELARFSSPSAEETIRRDLVEQISRFLDASFIDPASTETPNVRPGAVTVNATQVAATGTDVDAFLCDLASLQQEFLQNNLSPAGSYLVMSSVQAARLALFRNALGQYEFPNITANGGTIAGFPVITSESVPTNSAGESIIVMIKPSEILLADDGNVTLDASREATLDMNGGSSPAFNLFQRNCIGIRAERYITWKKRRASAVAYISGANYSNCVAS